MKTKNVLLGATILGGILNLAASPALSQVDTIIVTAEKRETNIQDTAIAITAFSGDDLDLLSIDEVQNIANFVPGLVLGNEADDFKVMIRGVGADNLEAVSDPGVALNIDGVYQARPSGFSAVVYDSERLEVLRGPQGTLYGRNATGGAINIISKSPDASELAAGADFTIGSYDRKRVRAFANIPVIAEKFALRLTGVREKRDGYQKNLVAGGTRGDDADLLYGRAQALFQPTDGLNVVLRIHGSEQKGVGPVRKRTATAPCTGSMLDAGDCGFTPDPTDLRTVYKDTAESRTLDSWGYSGEINLDLGDVATATFIGAFSERDFDLFSDSDQTEAAGPNTSIMPPDLRGTPGGATDEVGVVQDSKQKTFELRFASQSGGPVDWIVGGFYLDEDAAQATDINRNPSAPLVGPLATATNIFVDHDVNSKAWGVFGQASVEITPDLTFTGGIRYSDDEKSGIGGTMVTIDPNGPLVPPTPLCVSGCIRTVPGPPGPIPIAEAAPNPFMPSVSFDKVTWKGGLDYKPSDNSLLYFSASTGYKAGGFNFGADALTQYNPEEVLAFEVGSKNRFMEDRVQLNLAAFYYDYSDQQIIQVINQNINVQNADSTIYGFEVEGIYQLSESFQIDGHIAYLNARVDQFTTEDQARPTLGQINLAGNTLVNSPDWSGHIGAQHQVKLSNDIDLTTRVSTYLQSEVFLRIFNTDIERQGAYTKTDASVRISYRNRFWIQAGVDNIEDKDILSNMEVTDSGIFLASVRAPRTWSLRIGAGL